MNAPRPDTSSLSTEFSAMLLDRQSPPLPRFEISRPECESCESKLGKITLPPISEFYNTLHEPWPTRATPSSWLAQHENYQLQLPSPLQGCMAPRLRPFIRSHSAPARYAPYTLRQPSTTNKSLNPRTFVDHRDIEQPHDVPHRDIGSIDIHDHNYSHHTGHEQRYSHSDSEPDSSSDFLNVATPRPRTTESAVPHHVRDYSCTCGGCPVHERHDSDSVGRYLTPPELPSSRGTGSVQARYPVSHQQRMEADEGSAALGADEPLGGDEYGTMPMVESKAWILEACKKYCTFLRKDTEGNKWSRCNYPIENGKSATPCGKETVHSSLMRHIKTVHLGIRDHICKFCPEDPRKGPRTFGQRLQLRVHYNAKHRGVAPYRPFPCKHCPASFGDPSQRHKHYKKEHPNVEIKTRRKKPQV